MADELNASAKVGIRIERPSAERVGFFSFFFLITSFVLITFTGWLLVAEWMGIPLPVFLRISAGS